MSVSIKNLDFKVNRQSNSNRLVKKKRECIGSCNKYAGWTQDGLIQGLSIIKPEFLSLQQSYLSFPVLDPLSEWLEQSLSSPNKSKAVRLTWIVLNWDICPALNQCGHGMEYFGKPGFRHKVTLGAGIWGPFHPKYKDWKRHVGLKKEENWCTVVKINDNGIWGVKSSK